MYPLLPSSRRVAEGIDDFAVGCYPSVLWCVMCLFADEDEVCLSGVVLEQVLECGTDCAFVCYADAAVFLELGVVLFDGFVGGFDAEVWHCSWISSESRIIADFTDDADLSVFHYTIQYYSLFNFL